MFPPSYLEYISNFGSNILHFHDSNNHSYNANENDSEEENDCNNQEMKNNKSNHLNTDSLYNSFDQSALLALGVLIEEMTTSMLLPLAKQHVQRCQEIQKQEGNSKKYYNELTIPPEEAIINLLKEEEEENRI